MPSLFFFFNDTATTEIYTLSLHDALPISKITCRRSDVMSKGKKRSGARPGRPPERDRKSGSAGMPRPTSYAVFCLKKKKCHHVGTSCANNELSSSTMSKQ